MAGLINELIDTLSDIAVNYEYLLGLAEQKKEVLIKNDVDTLKTITSHENILVGKCQKLERARISITNDIAQVLAVPGKDLTLGRIMDIIKEQNEYERFKSQAERVRDVLDKLRVANEQNRLLLESSLDYVDYSINLIRSTFGGEEAFRDMNLSANANSIFDMKR